MQNKQQKIPLWNPNAFKTELNVFLQRFYAWAELQEGMIQNNPEGSTQSHVWFEDRGKIQNFFCFWVMLIYKGSIIICLGLSVYYLKNPNTAIFTHVLNVDRTGAYEQKLLKYEWLPVKALCEKTVLKAQGAGGNGRKRNGKRYWICRHSAKIGEHLKRLKKMQHKKLSALRKIKWPLIAQETFPRTHIAD